jgi:hypothetical protein
MCYSVAHCVAVCAAVCGTVRQTGSAVVWGMSPSSSVWQRGSLGISHRVSSISKAQEGGGVPSVLATTLFIINQQDTAREDMPVMRYCNVNHSRIINQRGVAGGEVFCYVHHLVLSSISDTQSYAREGRGCRHHASLYGYIERAGAKRGGGRRLLRCM